MLTAIKGYYNNGQIILSEQPPALEKTEVIVTFLENSTDKEIPRMRKFGGQEGQVTIPDDFNEPLDDLKDYM